MLILSLLIGGGFAVFCGVVLWLLPHEQKSTSGKESFEESSKRRNRDLDGMRRERVLNSAANELRGRR
jgi:hypothetical protein